VYINSLVAEEMYAVFGDYQEELSYATKSEQIDLLQKVLAATDADADEEQITGVDWSTKKQKVQYTNYLLFIIC